MTLSDEKYVLLTTFRKDGTAVPTPVWIVGLDDEFAPAPAEIADDHVAFALEHAHNGPDFFSRTPALAAGKLTGEHAVARQRNSGILGKNLQRGAGDFARDTLAHDEGRAPSAELNAADQFMRPEFWGGGRPLLGRCGWRGTCS